MNSNYLAWVILSAICVLTTITPTIWHAQQGNAAAVCLGFWIIVLNLTSVVDGIVWRNDDINRAPVWCDIAQKVQVGAPPGIIIACVCIAAYLAKVVSPNQVMITTEQAAWRRRWEYIACLVAPAAMMLLQPVWQPARFALQQAQGCEVAFLLSWPAVLLWLIWTPLLSLLGSICGIYIIARCLIHRRQFREIVESGSYAITLSRFFRLAALSLTYLLIYTPLSIWATVTIFNVATFYPFDWSFVHADFTEVLYIPADQPLPIGAWAGVVAGLCVLAFYGFGMETWMVWRGLLVRANVLAPAVTSNTPPKAGLGPSIGVQLQRLQAIWADDSTTSSQHGDPSTRSMEKVVSALA